MYRRSKRKGSTEQASHQRESFVLSPFSLPHLSHSFLLYVPFLLHVHTPFLSPLSSATIYIVRTYLHTRASVEYNLDSAESDKVLMDLLEQKDEQEMDKENAEERSTSRNISLFGLYPLPDREYLKENRNPATPPTEHQGIRLLVKISELRYAYIHACTCTMYCDVS